MKTTILRVLLAVGFALIVCRSASAQEVHTTKILMETKERVLRIESIIPATPKEVWKAFATEEGLKKWIAPVVALDLRMGARFPRTMIRTRALAVPAPSAWGL